jgi:hypothetical protein
MYVAGVDGDLISISEDFRDLFQLEPLSLIDIIFVSDQFRRRNKMFSLQEISTKCLLHQ